MCGGFVTKTRLTVTHPGAGVTDRRLHSEYVSITTISTDQAAEHYVYTIVSQTVGCDLLDGREKFFFR